MDDLMGAIPVAVIIEPLTALIGAAVVAGKVGPTDVRSTSHAQRRQGRFGIDQPAAGLYPIKCMM